MILLRNLEGFLPGFGDNRY